ncbi:MAG: DUF3293 domain-containing protein [Acidimicrobiales bacterium]
MISEPAWTSYTKAIVELTLPGRGSFTIYPARLGVAGDWPPELPAPVHVITAWNPGSDRPGEHVNRTRQCALEADLGRRGLEVWPAIGRDPDSPHREESAAVCGLTEAEAIALGAQYSQDAIFSWTPIALLVISCVDSRRNRAGWRFGTSPESDFSAV